MSSGSAGIGTTTPTQQLDVQGGNVNVQAGYTYKIGGIDVIRAEFGASTYYFGRAGNSTSTAPGNTGAGEGALYSATTGGANTAIGGYTLFANDGGEDNTALGSESMEYNTSGAQNVAVGEQSLLRNVTGNQNTVVGAETGVGTTSTSFSGTTLLGFRAGYSLGSSSYNTMLGYMAGYNTSTGSYNTLLGPFAGYHLTTGTNNIVIGHSVDLPDPTTSNTLDIANLIYATGLSNYGGTPRPDISDGSVGIGTNTPCTTSAPANCRLSVAGAIQAKEVVVNTGWSDYVFAPDYPLARLGDVADYVKENHHLPGIPSAEEVQEKGVSLGDMQSKLLAKVEELTLHMIEAEERSKRLEQENRDMRKRLTQLEAQVAGTGAPAGR